MAEIRCAVSGCYFWELGNVCSADTIWVKRTQSGAPAQGGRLEAGAFLTPQRNDMTSEDTFCETFRPKERETASV